MQASQKRSVRAASTTLPPPEPFPPFVRLAMERLFGRNLSDVRVVDSPLPALIGARAFAYGALIFAPRAEDLFETEAGWWLLGHELTHVLQQRDGRASIANASALPILVDSRLEAEADGMSRAAARAPSRPAMSARRATRPRPRRRPARCNPSSSAS